MYLFDPVQIKAYANNFYESPENDFTYRYQETTKLLGVWKARYIPYGPICKERRDFFAFLDYVLSQQFTRYTISLPLVLDSEEKELVQKKMSGEGFKKVGYRIHDSETIVVPKDEYSPNSRSRQYMRKGSKHFNCEVKQELNDKELKEAYSIYAGQTHLKNFYPKDLEAFRVVADNGLTSLAYGREDRKLHGFLMGYIHKIPVDYKNKIYNQILRLIFTAITLEGRDKHVGYLIHGKLFEEAFKSWGVDIVDFHGADRSKGRSYVSFKKKWGGHFVKYPGGYQKVNFL